MIKNEPGKNLDERFLVSIKRCGKAKSSILHIIIWNKTVLYVEINLIVILFVHEVNNENTCSQPVQTKRLFVSTRALNVQTKGPHPNPSTKGEEHKLARQGFYYLSSVGWKCHKFCQVFIRLLHQSRIPYKDACFD
jgi:hypothetical protein